MSALPASRRLSKQLSPSAVPGFTPLGLFQIYTTKEKTYIAFGDMIIDEYEIAYDKK